MLFIKALFRLWKLFVDVRENFLTIFKEISKDACQKQNYKSWHRGRKCSGGSFLIPLGIWFVSKDFFFFSPVCFPINTYIWGKRAFKYIWFKPRSSLCSFWHWQQYAVSNFRTRERKRCIFISPVMHTNIGHLMSGPWHGLFKVEPFSMLKVQLHSTALSIMVSRVCLF